MPLTTIGIKLDEETRERLQRISSAKERSPRWIMMAAIREYLDREERFELEREEDEARWQNYIQTGRFIDNATMMNLMDNLARVARGKVAD